MVSRALLMSMFEKHGEAEGEEEAFLRVLVHVNYKDKTVSSCLGENLDCRRGDSVMSFLNWGKILGWTRGRVDRFFKRCFLDGSILRVQDACPSHIRIPDYDAWTGGGKKEIRSGISTVGKSNVANSSGLDMNGCDAGFTSGLAFERFMDSYSEITQTPRLNVGRAQRYWKKLSVEERTKAFENIEDYYFNLSDIRYCMQAATYLRDKAYLNRYDY